ncbi:hypothetical protein DFP73DRAFT_567579, partial [Morchella snyderi]
MRTGSNFVLFAFFLLVLMLTFTFVLVFAFYASVGGILYPFLFLLSFVWILVSL